MIKVDEASIQMEGQGITLMAEFGMIVHGLLKSGYEIDHEEGPMKMVDAIARTISFAMNKFEDEHGISFYKDERKEESENG